MPRRSILITFILLFLFVPALGQTPVDQEANRSLRQHGLEKSQVMDLALWLTDINGPRLTGSPQLAAANEWALRQFESWGLQAQLEPWGPFGRGWTLDRFSLHATASGPRIAETTFPLVSYPKAWSPGIGRIMGEVLWFRAGSEEELEAYRGRLRHRIVLVDEILELDEHFEPQATRHTHEELAEMAAAGGQATSRTYSEEVLQRYRFQRRKMEFLAAEGPAVIVQRSRRGDYGTLFVEQASAAPGPDGQRRSAWEPSAEVVPQVVVATEDYNRLVRLMQAGQSVRLDLELQATYHDDDAMQHNVIAEIPGTDPLLRDEVVLLGAHIDSWHGGTGATDNASGTAVVMEAARILRQMMAETGRQPRRTIRFALWSGEEQGLFGSMAHVNRHYAELGGFGQAPKAIKPAQERISAYYNLDGGSGRIRGIYGQGNEGVSPIFTAWLAPFADLGATTFTLANTGGTDHIPFDMAGIPAFQFIQDPIAYTTRTHHSNFDSYDHLVADDLRQASTVIASFAFHTAQLDERLPRKPLRMAEAPAGTN
jgi:carboxypeptidase Q